MPRILARPSRRAVSMVISLAAQGMNFVAMVVPVVLGRFDAVAALLLCSAFSTISVHSASFAFPSIYPSLRETEDRSVSVKVCCLGLTAASSIMLVLGAILAASHHGYLGSILITSSLLTLTMGAYVTVTTLAISSMAHRSFSKTRLVYALVNIGLTCAISLLELPAIALSLAAVATFGIAFAYCYGDLRREGILQARADPVQLTRQQAFAYLRRARSAAGANLLGGLAAQSSVFAIGLLGPFGNTWAAAIRIVGGFGGVAQQVVAPQFEMDFAKGLRDETATGGLIYRGVAIGGLLALGTCVAVEISLFLGDSGWDVIPIELRVGYLLYTIGILTPTVVSRMLVMAGGARKQLTWIVLKIVSTAAVLAIFHNEGLGLALGLTELAFGVAFALLITRSDRAVSDLRIENLHTR